MTRIMLIKNLHKNLLILRRLSPNGLRSEVFAELKLLPYNLLLNKGLTGNPFFFVPAFLHESFVSSFEHFQIYNQSNM